VSVPSALSRVTKTLLAAVTTELVMTQVVAAAAIAARPDGVFIVALPGEPLVFVIGRATDPPAPAA
jgi:hypothetical protein